MYRNARVRPQGGYRPIGYAGSVDDGPSAERREAVSRLALAKRKAHAAFTLAKTLMHNAPAAAETATPRKRRWPRII